MKKNLPAPQSEYEITSYVAYNTETKQYWNPNKGYSSSISHAKKYNKREHAANGANNAIDHAEHNLRCNIPGKETWVKLAERKNWVVKEYALLATGVEFKLKEH